MQPDLWRGPVLPDLLWAGGGGLALGTIGGFALGSLVDPFRKQDLGEWMRYGSGLLGTFGVALVLFSRLVF